MKLARIIHHWEHGGCDEQCDLCLYGEYKNCRAEITRDTQALIKAYRKIKAERDRLVGIKVILLKDLEDRDQMLKKSVEELYPEFMKDYKVMEEELVGLYEELDRLEKELEEAKPTPITVQQNFDGINGNARNRRGYIEN